MTIGFLLPVPMGFRYELASAIDHSTTPPTYVDWKLRIDFNAPNAGNGQRNVKPLYGLQQTLFRIGDVVRKKSGSEFSGVIVGFYSTSRTPIGYAIESDAHEGTVQIFPEAALEFKT